MMSFEYTAWWVVPIVLSAFLLSWLLYRKILKDQELIWYKKALMFAFRFLGLLFLGLLLLKPFVQELSTEQYKAQLLILQDNSSSITQSGDSSRIAQDLNQKHQELRKLLEDKEIPYSSYTFGNELLPLEQFDFREGNSNISKALASATDLNTGNFIGGILLLSDGIYNQGENPAYYSKNLKMPIYTVGLGDSSVYKDVLIQTLDINTVNYSGQKIPFKLYVKAFNAHPNTSVLTIKQKGVVIFEQKIEINKEKFFKTIEGLLPEMEVGLHPLSFEIRPVEGEKNLINNQRTVYIKVVDSKKKILIVYQAPHPDINAIHFALESNKQFDIERLSVKKVENLSADYDLIILHQLPDNSASSKSLIRKISKLNRPVWHIISQHNHLQGTNQISGSIQLASKLKSSEWCESLVNPNFSLFNLSDELQDFLNHTPPLSSPFLKINSLGNNDVFLYKKIKQIATDKPLFLFATNEDVRSAYTLGEGFWKWKMFDYRENGSFDNFRQVINKTVQYLSSQPHQFGLITDLKNVYSENEEIVLRAEYYNESNEKTSGLNLNIAYWKDNKEQKEKIWMPENKGYSCKLGRLEPGEYQYKITSKELKKINETGRFIVKKVAYESISLTARYDILRSVSKNTNGVFFKQNNWLSMVDSIQADSHFKPRSYSTHKNKSWTDYLWILMLIFGLLSAEWFMRKYWGIR